MRGVRLGLLVLTCGTLVTGCEDSLAPRTGAIRVTLATAGEDLDNDGYGLRVENRSVMPIGTNASVVIAGLTPGRMAVRLQDMAVNCDLGALLADRRIDVVADDTVDVAFNVQCHRLIGSIIVMVNTSGFDRDEDGYMVSLDGGPPQPLLSDLSFDSVSVGSHMLVLTGIQDNCGTSASLIVHVQFRASAYAPYQVNCVRRAGHLSISTTTTGPDIDGDGYDVVVDTVVYGHIASNGVATINNVPTGSHTVSLRGVRRNCAVNGTNPKLATIAYKEVTSLAFDLSCTPLATVRISAVTSGTDQDFAYRVRLFGEDYDQSLDLTANGVVVMSSVDLGDYKVELTSVAMNCDIPDPAGFVRSITTSSGAITEVTFDISCAQAAQVAFVRDEGNGQNVGVVKTNGSGLAMLTVNGGEQHDPMYSPDGSKIAFRSSRDGNSEIYVMNADGTGQVRLTNNPGWDGNPAWSPDGNKIAFRTSRDGNDEIYVMDANGTNLVRLTNHQAFDAKPTWSPDGSKIAFESSRGGNSDIYVMDATGANVTRLTDNGRWNGLPSWSPDGTRIAFVHETYCDYYYGYYCLFNIAVMNADGSGLEVLESQVTESEPEWSPDGKWIAFEAGYCDYYYGCVNSGISAIRLSDKRRVEIVVGFNAHNPTWRP